MNDRFSEELFLTNETGKMLYHKYAEHMPIIDYHCHLQPVEIAENKEFEDLGEMWLRGDHYKWRCMRTFGIDEKYITGDASYYEKYMKFAEILPQLVGNPIYIWCALELKRYFDIDEPLTAANAQEIYDRTKKLINRKAHDPPLVHGAQQCASGLHHRRPHRRPALPQGSERGKDVHPRDHRLPPR